MKRLMIIALAWVILPPLALAKSGKSSTFVGNGGNAGDLELTVALKQINDTLEDFAETEAGNDKLCSCQEFFKGRPVCDLLESLNEPQQKFCSKILLKNSERIFKLTKNIDNFNFNWTEKEINIKEGGQYRTVDAVTDPKTRTMTFNIKRFLDMPAHERVFLLNHEIYHTLKHNGKHYEDLGTVGPFKGANGGRNLINAVSAATVMQSFEYGALSKYRRALNRPQGWKHHWIDLSLGRSQTQSTQQTYATDSFSRSGLSYRYYLWKNWGIHIASDNIRESTGILSSITLTEHIGIFAAGITYRYFPAKDPLSFKGQSHWVFSALLEQIRSEAVVSDSFVEQRAQANSLSPRLSCNYFMPLFGKGFWLYFKGSVASHKYELKELNVNYDGLRTDVAVGASYGF